MTRNAFIKTILLLLTLLGGKVAAWSATIADLKTITSDYVFIADDITASGTASLTTNTLYDGGLVLTCGSGGNSVATNKGSMSFAGGTHLNSLRLKNSQDMLAIKVGAACSITFYTQSQSARGITVGTTSRSGNNSDSNDSGCDEYGQQTASTTEWTCSVSEPGIVYIASYGGDFYFAGFQVTFPTTGQPAITTQPASAIYQLNATAEPLSVTATAVNSGALSYQWYRNETAKSALTTEGATAIDGATSSTYTPATTAVGTTYYCCRVTEAGSSNVATTSIATVQVTPAGYIVSYALGSVTGTQGTLPAATGYVSSLVIPTNRTLFKSGHTLTAWNDGTTDHAIGSEMSVTATTTLTPVFTPNTCELADATSDVTVMWDFQTKNGAPAVGWQGSDDNTLVAQATVNGSVVDVRLQVNTNPGKFNNQGHNDWAQVNEGTVFILPSASGAVVRAFTYNEPKSASDVKSDLDGNAYSSFASNVATFETTNTSGSSTLNVTGGSYFRYIELTYPGTPLPVGAYTNTWQFGKSNGSEEFSLQGSPEYEYTVNGHTLVVNTAAGKLNNASRNDQWAQCNDGTLMKVPAYVGAKLSWGRYNGGSATGFTIGGTLYNDYYVATADGTASLTATGIGYLSHVAVEPVTMYAITGSISGGDADGSIITLTAKGNGQAYSATVSSGSFEMSVPADTYSLMLSGSAYVIDSPASLTVASAGSVGTINVAAAAAQTVSGQIAQAPAEAFTLTFTGSSHTETLECAAGATSFAKDLAPDTYVISSSAGTLSALSQESFTVVNTAVAHNIYFPTTIPAATQQNITVDNTASMAANVYNTVSDALTAAKAGNISNPIITLTSGQTYREQVVIDMPGVTLQTSGAEKAIITFYYGIGYNYYSLNASGIYDRDRAMTRNSMLEVYPARWGATVLVRHTASNFKATNIIFENSFNQYYTDEEVADGVTAHPTNDSKITYDRTLREGDGAYMAADSKGVTERAAAIAFENNPSGCQLYDCVFKGSQDTFFTSGKLYVKHCDIWGNTDYIFGGGDVVFDECNLVIGGYSDQQATAYITANNPTLGEYYIFRDCTVRSAGRTYTAANLGRDWGGTKAGVYFFNLKNEIGNSLSYSWTNMGGAVSAGTANLHIYDFDDTKNAAYNTTGSAGANVNGTVSDADAFALYTGVIDRMGFTPDRILCDYVLSDSKPYIRIADGNTNQGRITLNRTLTADRWSTIVLPFTLSASSLTTVFGVGTEVAELTGGSEQELIFSTTLTGNEMKANRPYAIKVTSTITAATATGTLLQGTAATQSTANWDFIGTYAAASIPVGSYFFSSNQLWQAADATNSISPYRAYFVYRGMSSPARQLAFSIDGETTGIQGIYDLPICDLPIYNLGGRKIVNSKSVNSKLQKGLYITGGKKVVVK